MRVDIEELTRFYQGRLGALVTNIIISHLGNAWGNINNFDVLGFGYAAPFLETAVKNARRVINFCPNTQGTSYWPSGEKNLSVLGEETDTPFLEAQFERILCAHVLEEAPNPQKTLREIWRILAPEGEVIFIIANRNSLWSRLDKTPFGHGRPFSRRQVVKLFENSMFEIMDLKRVLFWPPFATGINKKGAESLEKIGSRLWPSFGGLIFVQAKKRLFIEPNIGSPEKMGLREVKSASYFSIEAQKTHKI